MATGSSTLIAGTGGAGSTVYALELAGFLAWGGGWGTLYKVNDKRPIVYLYGGDGMFTSALQQIVHPDNSWYLVNKVMLPSSKILQYYPPLIENQTPIGNKNFQWAHTTPQLLWHSISAKGTRSLVEILRKLSPKPATVFLDGLIAPFHLANKVERTKIHHMVSELKQRGIAVIIIVKGKVSTWNNSHWDNYIQVTQRERGINNSNNLKIEHLKCGVEVDMPKTFYIRKNPLTCEFSFPKYQHLEPLVRRLVAEEFTAQEIILKIKTEYSIDISPSMLTKLRRNWGIRVYKKRGIPRKYPK